MNHKPASSDTERATAAEGGTQPLDDLVLPFRAELASGVGRLVRLGPAIDQILSQHNYPEAVSHLLGEAVTLAAILGTAIKFDGRFTLQTQSDGPVGLLVADFATPGELRGYASFDSAALAALEAEQGRQAPPRKSLDSARLLGKGHLAMTIDQGADMQRYQGVVPLGAQGLLGAANDYFVQSEQLPTFIHVAVGTHDPARTRATAEEAEARNWRWRAGGLIVQHLSRQGGRVLAEENGEEDAPPHSPTEEAEDDWTRARLLAGTVEDHELLDPALSPERLLFRLFHEERVRVYPARTLAAKCRCSRARIENVLKSFAAAEIAGMVRDGKISVTCEFCNTPYTFDPADFVANSG